MNTLARSRALHAILTAGVWRAPLHGALAKGRRFLGTAATELERMSTKRIYLSDQAVEHSLGECVGDPVFQKAFGRMLEHFATQARAHDGSRMPDDVSVKDVEAQLLREFYKVTILYRLQRLANGELGRRFPMQGNEWEVQLEIQSRELATQRQE